MPKMYSQISVLLQLLTLWVSISVSSGSPFSPLTHKDLRRAAHHQSLLTAMRELHFCGVPLKTAKSRFLTVTNPTAVPVTVQLLLLPGNFRDIIAADCPQAGDALLDEDEFDSKEDWEVRCNSDEMEVTAVRELSRVDPPLFPRFNREMRLIERIFQLLIYKDSQSPEKARQSAKLSQLPRFKCGKRCSWSLPDPETNSYLLQKQTQGFFLTPGGREAVQIPAGGSASIGPIVFQPQAVGSYEGKLLVRSSAGLSQVVEMRGEGQYARVAFRKDTVHRHASRLSLQLQEMQSLAFDITPEDIDKQVTPTGKLPPVMRITKVFEAENVGTIPLTITEIRLNGGECSLYGVTIDNCDQVRIVQPRETLEVVLHYDLAFYQKAAELQIWVIAEEDTFFLPLEVATFTEDYADLAAIQLVRRDSLSYFLAELCTLVQVLCAVGYFSVVAREVCAAGEKRRAKVASLRRPCSRKGVFVYTRLQGPLLTPSPFPVVPEKQAVPAPPAAPAPAETPHSDDSQRVKRIKKTKGPILKFSPTQTDQLKENSQPQTSIFATNKLLLAKKKPKRSESSDLPADGEKQISKEMALLESRTTAAHSEDGDVENEDEYLDDYKTREGLFSGFYSDPR